MKRPTSYLRGCLVGIVLMLLACSVTLATLNDTRRVICRDPCPLGQEGLLDGTCSYGNCRSLQGGFPLSFVYDDGGGSPTSSLGKIDSADLFTTLKLLPFLVDAVVYGLLLWVAWRGGQLVYQQMRRRM